MASFEKRGKTTRAVVSVMVKGERRKVSQSFSTKKEAITWSTLMEADKFQGKQITASNMTFVDYFTFWMDNFKKNDIRESTYYTYKSFKKMLIGAFGEEIRLSDLTYQLLQTKLDKMGKRCQQSTMIIFVSRVKACLRDAKLDGYILSDVYTRLKPHGKAQEDKHNFLSAKEFDNLAEYLFSLGDSISKAQLAILVALETGMRIGEIIALKYTDVSAPFGTINITKSYSTILNEITKTKTKSSVRIIKAPMQLIQMINQTNDHSSPYIFYKQVSHVWIGRVLKELLKERGLTNVTIHGLRHSHASYLLYQGVSINYVSKRLGHANVATTMNIYAHMLEEEQTEEEDKTLGILSMSPNVPKAKKKRIK